MRFAFAESACQRGKQLQGQHTCEDTEKTSASKTASLQLSAADRFLAVRGIRKRVVISKTEEYLCSACSRSAGSRCRTLRASKTSNAVGYITLLYDECWFDKVSSTA